jgi:hypothetical protein
MLAEIIFPLHSIRNRRWSKETVSRMKVGGPDDQDDTKGAKHG